MMNPFHFYWSFWWLVLGLGETEGRWVCSWSIRFSLCRRAWWSNRASSKKAMSAEAQSALITVFSVWVSLLPSSEGISFSAKPRFYSSQGLSSCYWFYWSLFSFSTNLSFNWSNTSSQMYLQKFVRLEFSNWQFLWKVYSSGKYYR